MTLRLTPAEVQELTDRVQPAAQLRRLREMGIRAYRSDNPEWPVVVLHVWLDARKTSASDSPPKLKSERKAA